MTPIFKVVMKHTKEVLMDFIQFDNRIRHPMAKVHLSVMGVGFLVLGIMLRESLPAMFVFGGFGLLWLVILVTRKRIAFAKLSVQDEDYINQTETEFTFGQKEIEITNPSWDEKMHVQYSELNAIYEDDTYFYLSRNNEELYLLQFNSFVMGEAVNFRGFLEDKTEKNWIPTKLGFKERVKLMNANRKEMDRLHDENIRKQREEKEKENN